MRYTDEEIIVIIKGPSEGLSWLARDVQEARNEVADMRRKILSLEAAVKDREEKLESVRAISDERIQEILVLKERYICPICKDRPKEQGSGYCSACNPQDLACTVSGCDRLVVWRCQLCHFHHIHSGVQA